MAKQLKMIQNPIGQGWMISLDDPIIERTGPIKITSGPAEGVEIFFVQEEGQYIIKNITDVYKRQILSTSDRLQVARGKGV